MIGGWPSLADDLLLINADGLHAINTQTLGSAWVLEVGGISDRAVVGDVVVAHTLDSSNSTLPAQTIIGIDRQSGTVLWSQPGGIAGSGLGPYLFNPTTDGRLIYTSFGKTCQAAGCISGSPMALNPIDGTIVWKNDDISVRQIKSPIVVKEHLIYDEAWTFEDGVGVYALNPADGATQWVLPSFRPQTSLTLFNGGAVVRSNSVPGFYTDQE